MILSPLGWGEDVYYCVEEHNLSLEPTGSGDAYELKRYKPTKFTFKYEAAENKIGDAETMKMILQDCLRILDVRDTDEERESQDGGEHDLRSVSDLGEGGETCRTEHT